MSNPSLQSVLQGVVRNELGVSGALKHEVNQLSFQVAAGLKRELRRHVEELDFPSDPVRIGSTADELQIPGKLECDYLLYVEIKPDGSYIQLETPGSEGYYRVALRNPVPKLNKMIVSDGDTYYLSPIKVHTFMVGQVTRVLQSVSPSNVTRIVNQSNQAGPNIKLQVFYDNGRSSFDMDFVPCLNIGGKQLVAKCHPSLGHMHTLSAADASTLRWRQTMGTNETVKIAPLDKGDGGWSKQVCRLVKYLRANNTQFHAFPSYIYKTVFLHLLDRHHYPSAWRENNLAERFLDFMRLLEDVLLSEELNHYFLLKEEGVKRNLLKPRFQSLVIREVGQYVKGLNRRGQQAYLELFPTL